MEWSHIHSKHIQGDSQPSYAVDGSMEELSYRYYQTCWPRFGKTIETVSLVCAQMMPWHSNWGSKPTWNGSHIPLQTYTRRRLTIYICCGWEYGSIIMPLPPNLLAKIWEVSGNYGSLLDGKWCRGAVVETLNPHRMAHTSTPNIYKVIVNVPMLWMGVWIHHHAIPTTLHTC